MGLTRGGSGRGQKRSRLASWLWGVAFILTAVWIALMLVDQLSAVYS